VTFLYNFLSYKVVILSQLEVRNYVDCIFSTQENLLQNMKDLISEQIKLGFKNHASVLEDSVINAVRSRAVTPSPHVETQVRLHIPIKLQSTNGIKFYFLLYDFIVFVISFF
jgi:hypothetical protein